MLGWWYFWDIEDIGKSLEPWGAQERSKSVQDQVAMTWGQCREWLGCYCGCSVTKSCLTLCYPMDYSTLDFLVLIISWSLLKLISIESMMPFNHLILCHPLLLPSIFPSIRIFSMSRFCIRWPKYCSFSFSLSPSNEHSGLISFRMDCLDLLAAQGTLKSLLWHHSSKASILRSSAFFVVQLSHAYMTTGKP